MSEPEDLPRYALRIQPRAERDIAGLLRHQEEQAGQDSARAYYAGLFAEIATLSASPRRFPLAPERRYFHQEIRQMLYRRTPGSGPVWRVIFAITGEEPGAADPPTLSIIHVRHGAQRPISRRESGEIEGIE